MNHNVMGEEGIEVIVRNRESEHDEQHGAVLM